jgi:hypothetical protein
MAQVRLVRDSTNISIGDTAGNRNRITTAMDNSTDGSWSLHFLDSPATTSSTTYKIQVASAVNSRTLGVNRTYDDADQTYRGRGTSTITVLEVAG